MFEYQFMISRDEYTYVVGIKSETVDNAWKVARLDHSGLNVTIQLIAYTKLAENV